VDLVDGVDPLVVRVDPQMPRTGAGAQLYERMRAGSESAVLVEVEHHHPIEAHIARQGALAAGIRSNGVWEGSFQRDGVDAATLRLTHVGRRLPAAVLADGKHHQAARAG